MRDEAVHRNCEHDRRQSEIIASSRMFSFLAGGKRWSGAQAKITCSFDGPEGPFLVTLFAIEPDGCSRFPQ